MSASTPATASTPASSTLRTRRLVVAAAINGALVVAETLAGVSAHSTALLSDAGHNLADVGAVVLSLAAVRWALRPRSELRSYGNHRATILAALANATVLAVVTCAVVALAVERLVHPVAVHGVLVSGVAGAALVMNGVAALALRDTAADLNMRSAALHMAADAAASAAVLSTVRAEGEGQEDAARASMASNKALPSSVAGRRGSLRVPSSEKASARA